MTLQADVQAAFAATLVDEWVRCGVTDAVLAPGSRSTPLALAVHADRRLTGHVHLDERSAGFFALGLGLATGRPAVVLTTSGTAAAELHPAVVEAHQARVPLIACTADRPPDLHHVGAPQTIEQVGLFGAAVRWAYDPGVADEAASSTWRSVAARAVAEATAHGAGPRPVHLNLAFREPLVGERGALTEGRAGGEAWHRAAPVARQPADVAGLDRRLVGRRGVVVAGAGSGPAADVHALADRLGWPVLADARSGCRSRPGAVVAFDAVLRDRGFTFECRPEAVLRLGQPPASKVLAQWLAACGAEQVAVDPHGGWPDPDRTAAVVVPADPGAVCRALATGPGAVPADRSWRQRWLDAEAAAQEAIEGVLAAHDEPTEPGVARALTASLPPETTLLVSSSMPVRDVEWFGHPGSAHRVLANRGANGIDGVVSTALGVAAADPSRPTVGLLGDLAFLHDAGGLLWARQRSLRLVLVVVDNDGGGIFSFLPQARQLPAPTFEALLGTPHGIDLAALAAAHGIPVARVEKAAELVPAVEAGLAAGGVSLVHVRTDRAANVALHAELNRAVAAALASASGSQ